MTSKIINASVDLKICVYIFNVGDCELSNIGAKNQISIL